MCHAQRHNAVTPMRLPRHRCDKYQHLMHLRQKANSMWMKMQGSHTPFWEWAGALRIGKISGVSTKIGKIYIVYMHEVSIARLIQIVNLALFFEII